MDRPTVGVELSGIPASDRARGEYLSEELRKHGYNAHNVGCDENVDLRIMLKRDFRRKKSEKYRLFDVSDAILFPPRSTHFVKKFYQRAFVNRRIGAFLSDCDAVVVASKMQQKIMKKYNRSTYVIPDKSFYHEKYNPSVRPDPKERIVFVWDGQSHNFKYLQEIIEANIPFFRKSDVLLKVVTDKVDAQRDIDIERLLCSYNINAMFIEWDEKTFVTEVNSSHVGLAPVDLKCPHAASKPDNKLTNYQGLALPVIASSTTAYIEFAKRSPGGVFVCSRNDDWGAALKFVKENIESLIQVGRKARKFVCTNYTQDVLIKSWIKVINDVVGTR